MDAIIEAWHNEQDPHYNPEQAYINQKTASDCCSSRGNGNRGNANQTFKQLFGTCKDTSLTDGAVLPQKVEAMFQNSSTSHQMTKPVEAVVRSQLG